MAVFAVLVGHFYPGAFGFPIASFGVRLFFVLSGYLITRILLDCREIRDSGYATTGQMLGRFYGRRALRLLPALWFALAIGWPFIAEVREQWPWHVTYLSNVYFIRLGGLTDATGHLWTLAVEEQFYLAWPLAALGLARWRLVPIVATAALLAASHRFYVAASGGQLVEVQPLPWECADALGVGALLALLLDKAHAPERFLAAVRSWGITVGLAVSVLAYAALPEGSLSIATNGLFSVVLSAGLVAGSVAGFSGLFGRLLESRPATYIGRISYGIYVYHFFLLTAWERYAPRWLPHHPGWTVTSGGIITLDRVLYFALLVTLSICIAALSWRFIEQPVLRLKGRIPYRPAPLLATRGAYNATELL